MATKMSCVVFNPVTITTLTRPVMSFFGKDLIPRKIEIDSSTLTSESDEVRSRLNRIDANYQKLSEILGDLETRIKEDDHLRAINESIDEKALEQGVDQPSKKRKWRPRKSAKGRSKTRRKSAGPNKPR